MGRTVNGMPEHLPGRCSGTAAARCAGAAILAALVAIPPCTAGTEDPELDRDGFGASGLPVWSHLTPFEIESLARADAARGGDADALLALYLIAGGDVRTGADYRAYRDRVHGWLDSFQRRDRDPAKLGAAILETMHTRFLAGHPGQRGVAPPARYDREQSRLSRLITTGDYNCLSSALLYIVLARGLELPVEAVIVPSHAFVQMTVADGAVHEIETTAPDGFGIRHDEEFYGAANIAWFRNRGLEPMTWEGYLQREIISPLALAARSMWAGHAAAGSMRYVDRLRLAELRAHLAPDDATAVGNRLAFYHAEFERLGSARAWPALTRMYATIAPFLDELESDPAWTRDIRATAAAVRAEHAWTLIEGGDIPAAIALLERRLGGSGTMPGDDYLYRSLNRYVDTMIANGQFDKAITTVTRLAPECEHNRICNKGLSALYDHQGLAAGQRGDWQGAVAAYLNLLELAGDAENAATIRGNIETAYLNQAAEALRDEEWETALRALDACIEENPDAGRCAAERRKVRERYGVE